MKAFEKWLGESRPEYKPYTHDDWFYRQGWEAALEWVLESRENCKAEGEYNCAISEMIQKELEELNDDHK